MNTYVMLDKTFEDSRLELDGIRFERCRFVRCRMIYAGGENVDFTDCSFEECEWIFTGPAERTLSYLASIYRGLGGDGQSLAEAIFESIRRGEIFVSVIEEARRKDTPRPAKAIAS